MTTPAGGQARQASPGGSAPRRRRQLTVTSAAVSLLGALPLGTVFQQWTWLLYSIVTVTALCGVALMVRSLRLPEWLPTAAMVAALPLVLAGQFPSGGEFLGVLPTARSLEHFGSLLGSAGREMAQYSTPAPDRPGFLFLATLGVAATAIVIDLFAVAMRRPAVAGLPMLAIYSVPVAVRDDSVSLLPFVLGAAGFLWLLVSDNVDRVRRFGRRFSGEGRGIEIWESSPLAAAGQRLGVVGIAAAIMLPLAVPGMTTGLLDRFAPTSGGLGGSGGNGSGTGATIGLYALLSGSLNRDKSFAMVKVRNTDPSPYYLRMGIADQITDTGFRSRAVTGGGSVTNRLPSPPATSDGGHWPTYRADIEVVNLDSRYLPVYLQPTKIEKVGAAWRYEPNSSVVYATRDTTRKKKYTVEYAKVDYTPDALRTAGPIGQADRAVTREMIVVPDVDEVRTLTGRIATGKTQYDRVLSILNYFSPANGFAYSLKTEPGTSGSQIVDFLTNKRGFCVQYSAAMAWMVRQAGYPARVAFGFTRGNAQPDGATTLTNFNLHAWTEVYFSGFGWVPFDATPATGVPGSVSTGWAPNPSRPIDANVTAPGGGATAPGDPQASAAAPQDHDRGPDQQAAGNAGTTPQRRERPWPVWTALGALAALALLAAPALQRRRRRQRRTRHRAAGATGTAPPADGPVVVAEDGQARYDAERAGAHAAWDELLDTMVDYGIPPDDAETPRATAARLGAPLPAEAATAAGLLGSAEEHARYARRPTRAGDLGAALTTVRRALAARTTRRARLRILLAPPSVLRHWQLTLGAAATSASVAASDATERLSRLLPRRRRADT